MPTKRRCRPKCSHCHAYKDTPHPRLKKEKGSSNPKHVIECPERHGPGWEAAEPARLAGAF